MKDYCTWQNERNSIEQRAEKINDYLTEELQALNADTVREDIPTSFSVGDINIWSVFEEKKDIYAVVYSVVQKIRKIKIANEFVPPIEFYFIKIS